MRPARTIACKDHDQAEKMEHTKSQRMRFKQLGRRARKPKHSLNRRVDCALREARSEGQHNAEMRRTEGIPGAQRVQLVAPTMAVTFSSAKRPATTHKSHSSVGTSRKAPKDSAETNTNDQSDIGSNSKRRRRLANRAKKWSLYLWRRACRPTLPAQGCRTRWRTAGTAQAPDQRP